MEHVHAADARSLLIGSKEKVRGFGQLSTQQCLESGLVERSHSCCDGSRAGVDAIADGRLGCWHMVVRSMCQQPNYFACHDRVICSEIGQGPGAGYICVVDKGFCKSPLAIGTGNGIFVVSVGNAHTPNNVDSFGLRGGRVIEKYDMPHIKNGITA